MHHSASHPVTFIIFGATGDLATKKLFPALFALFRKEKLPLSFSILAVSRRDWQDGDFRSFIREKMPAHEKEAAGDFAEFIEHIYYSPALFDRNKGYVELHDKLKAIDLEHKAPSTKFFYLSLAPTFYENVLMWIGEAKLFEEMSSRLLIEKPFGVDEASAGKLHSILRMHLHESQILFVDHYLGKDALRAVRSLHSSSHDLDSILTAKNVESIRLRIFETIGVEKRGASYDSVGAFRDVAQNHMMVMLTSLVAPARGVFARWPHLIRARLLSSLAQAGSGEAWARGGQYAGYIKEENITKESQTETAFAFNTIFTKGRLKGVRVMFEGGKKLAYAEASIEVALKDGETLAVNIQPHPSIVIRTASGHDTIAVEKKGDAYEHIFMAAILGDTRMFTSFKEIQAGWRIADSVVSSWRGTPPAAYSPEKPFVV